MLLPPEHIKLQPIKVSKPQNKPQPTKPEEDTIATRDKSAIAKHDKPEEKSKEAEELGRSHPAEPPTEPQPTERSVEDEELDEEITKDQPSLPDRVKELNQSNVLFLKIREYLANPENHDRPNVYLRGSRAANGLLYKDNKLWVADDLRLDVIREVHDQPAVGHAGVRRTILLIQQHYFWPKMKQDVNRYIRNCHVCRRAKAPRDRYNGTLKPLPVPERPWTDITMDFVTGLPECELKNTILMVVDRLAKERVYIPCSDQNEGTNAEATAKMLLHNVWRRHGLPSSVVSDQGPQFVSAV